MNSEEGFAQKTEEGSGVPVAEGHRSRQLGLNPKRKGISPKPSETENWSFGYQSREGPMRCAGAGDSLGKALVLRRERSVEGEESLGGLKVKEKRNQLNKSPSPH